MKPDVEAFFDTNTNTVTYVVSDSAAKSTAGGLCSRLNVKPEQDDVRVANCVVSAFEPHFARVFCALFTVALDEVVKSDGFSGNEPAFKISMDLAGRRSRRGALGYGPGPAFLRA